MLVIKPQWAESPGVRDRVLARTWGRLEMWATGTDKRTHWISRFLNRQTETSHTGIYGTLFPLAEWIVENWWFLFHEPRRVAELRPSRELWMQEDQRAWLRRHSMLSAREGGNLPDVVIYRDGGEVAIRWFADNADDRAIQFVESGEVRLHPMDAMRVFSEIVTSVLLRLEDSEDADAQRLAESWQAIAGADAAESELCRAAATMGVDPYRPDELTDELLTVLEGGVSGLPDSAKGDLLEATDADSIRSDLAKAEAALSGLTAKPSDPSWRPGAAGSEPAHRFGYRLAAEMRDRDRLESALGQDVVTRLAGKQRWPLLVPIQWQSEASAVLGAVLATDDFQPCLATAQATPVVSTFRLARALYFSEAKRARGPRLLTGAYTYDQRASRAFAAELLVPSERLRLALRRGDIEEQIAVLAQSWGVSDLIVRHQIENHRLLSKL